MRKYYKILCVILMYVLIQAVCLPISARAAESSASFFASDADVAPGRCFDVSLNCCASVKVTAFIATVSFDGDSIEYRSIKAVDPNAQISVNDSAKGEIVFVYFCEHGTDCSKGTELVEITFKALKEGEQPLYFGISEAISDKAEYITLSSVRNSVVNVTKTSTAKSDSSINVQQETDVSEYTEQKQAVTVVKENRSDIAVLVMLLMSLLVVLCIAVIITYKITVKRVEKKKEQGTMLDFPPMENIRNINDK